MKFLIIRFSSIGDIVLTTPVVRCLKQQVLTAEVHYLTKPAFRSLLEANPYVDKIHTLQDDWQAMIRELQAEDFDYIIDLHHNLRTLKVKRALGKKTFAFNKLNIDKWLLTALKINRMPDVHIVDRYLGTVASFGIKNDGRGLDYFIPEKDTIKEEDIPASHHAGYIGMVIGAALNTKKYPLHHFKTLCEQIEHPIILLGGKEDIAEGDAIAAIDKFKIYNACGKFNINESADLVRRSKLIISNDTGLMHIAAAFKKPIISLWGNTVPEFGMYPYYGATAKLEGLAVRKTTVEKKLELAIKTGQQPGVLFDNMEIEGLSCRPCSKIGYKKCPKGHFKCMELIQPAAVTKLVNERLKKS